MKTAAALASLIVAAFAAAPAFGAADSGGTQVLLQRTPDGRVILTDRPLEGATTQRTWQVPREDPAAARDRSDRVRAEADAVSERIAKRMLAEEELAARRDLERMRLAALNPGTADLQNPDYGAWGGYWGGGWWGVAPPINRPIRPRPGFGKHHPGSMNKSSFPERPDFLPMGPPPVVGRVR